MEVSHPLEGNKVFFYYKWTKVKNYQGDKERWDDVNTWTVKNVADSAKGDSNWYQVIIYGYEKGTNKNFYTSQEFCFYVDITKATPTVTPTP
ncbi:MAG: hypothetical protein RSA73_02340 [Anaerovoracaceae bacterium]